MQKNLIVLCIFLFMGPIFPEERLSFWTPENSISNRFMREKTPLKREIHVIPYIQADVIIPGIGLSLQWEGSRWGCELDASLSSIFLTTIAKSSFSTLLFTKSHKHCFNFGIGPGRIESMTSHPMTVVVLSIGYSYKGANNVYRRVGLNIFTGCEKGGKYQVPPIPFYRMGYFF